MGTSEEERISAHRVVLAASSNYFKTLFTRDMTENRLQEVYLGNMEASVVDALVKFCYSGEINISNANVLNILSTARLFQLDQVEELCREFLKRKLEPSSSLAVRPVTDSISCPEADENVLHNFEVITLFASVDQVRPVSSKTISIREFLLITTIYTERLSKQLLSTRQKDSSKFREVLYVVGGEGHASGEYFDPGEKFPVWRQIPSMSITRGYAGVATLDDLLYVVGGLSNGKRVNSAERY
ncbi:BTB/POZ domain protein [Cooperia oncophora]